MPAKRLEALARIQAPHPDGIVITARHNLVPGHAYAVDLVAMPPQRLEALARIQMPYLDVVVPTARHNLVPGLAYAPILKLVVARL